MICSENIYIFYLYNKPIIHLEDMDLIKVKKYIHMIKETPPDFSTIAQKEKAFIDLHNGHITISHSYNENVIKDYKLQTGFKYFKDIGLWIVKIQTIDQCQYILSLNKWECFHWELSDSAYNFIQDFIKQRKDSINYIKTLRDIKNGYQTNELDWLKYFKVEPFPYQKIGISFLRHIKGVGMIADDMGLGKSLQALGYVIIEDKRTLIVCPSSLVYNWEKEVRNITYRKAHVLTEMDIELYNKDYIKKAKKEKELYIISFNMLEKYQDVIKKLNFECVIGDECHNIKNTSSKNYKNFKKLRNIPSRILLSGTPIKNNLIEFYSSLNFLRPDLFPTKTYYGLRYCDAILNENAKGEFTYKYQGEINLPEFYKKLELFYLRRMKSQVLKELPQKTVLNPIIEFNTQDLKIYNSMKSEILKKGVGQHNIMVQSQLLNQLNSLIKAKYIKRFIEENINSQKIIIFSQFINTQEFLLNNLDNAIYLSGKLDQHQKHKVVEQFANDPKIKYLISSLKVGGTGFNDLVVSDTVIFMDRFWEQTTHLQAEDRIFRLGQKSNVYMYYFDSHATIDQFFKNFIFEKQEKVEKLTKLDTSDLYKELLSYLNT